MWSSEQARLRGSLLAAVWLSAAVGIGLLPATATAQSTNPIVFENQQPGSSGWQVDTARVGTDATGQIKGYASAVSVNKGENITFNVSTNPAQPYTIDVYRIGWYQGLGGRLMQHIGPLNGVRQPTCPMDATTGMIACNWTPGYTLATQTSWTSGVYVAVLTNQQAYQNYIIFVVRDDNPVAPLLYQSPVTTYQAYNNYPDDGVTGKSLYTFNSYGSTVPATGALRAAKVSFDRPYGVAGIDSGFFSDYGEVNFIRWIERSGYEVTYATDLDLHTNGSRLLNYRALLSVGHDEYWSKPMYDAALAARDAGVNLGFFGADAVYWQIRLEASVSGVPDRVVVCYKDAIRDPIGDPTLKTILWRDAPVNRPEQTLMGVQYGSQIQRGSDGLYAPYVVTNSGHWVYAGTGFHDGDTVPGLVGYEADRWYSEYPGPNVVPDTYTLLSNSPYLTTAGTPDYSNASIYQAPSGAWVFATASMNWNWGLDSYGNGWNVVDPRIQRATANILDRFVASPVPDFFLTASPLSQTAAPGDSVSYSVTINAMNGFSDVVTWSVSGLPTGATASFAPNPASASSTLMVTTDLNSPPGTYTLTITGISGNLTHTTTVSLALFPPDFALSASPSSQTVMAGSATSYNITIAPSTGFTGPVTLSVSGLPTGVTASFAPNPATTSSTLSVATSSSTPAGTYTLTMTGVSGSLTHTTTASLSVVTPPPVPVAVDAVGPGAGGASVSGGSSVSWSHTVTTTGSNLLLTVGVAVGKSPDTGSLTVTYNGVPMTSAGIVHSNNRTDGFVQLFYLKAPATGTRTVQVTFSGGSATIEAGSVSFTGVDQTTPVRNIATSFGTGTSPNVVVTSQPGNMVVDAMVTGCNGAITSSQTLRWLKMVNCATAGGNGAQSTAAGAASVPMGYTVPSDWWGLIGMDVAAAGGPAPSFDFTLSNQGNQSVAQGSAVANTVTATLSSGTAQPVTYSTAGLPAGVTASYSPTSCSPTCSTIMSISANASASVGTSTITVTGTAGSISHTTTFTLTVTATASFDFTLSNQGNQSVAQGSAVANTVMATLSSGTAQPVTYSSAGLPAGVTASYSPTSCSPTCSTTMSISANASAPPGTSTITVTGTAGSMTRTTSFTLTVTPSGTGSAPTVSTVSPASGPVWGGTATTITGTNFVPGGFAADVLIDMNVANAVGTTVTPTIMSNGTIGTYDRWTQDSPINGLTVGPHRIDRAAPVTVNGVIYPTDHVSKSLQLDHAYSFRTVGIHLNPGVRAFTVAALITFGPPQVNPTSAKLWDYMGVFGATTGGFAMMQLNNGDNGVYALNVETDDVGIRHSANIVITPGATYWCVLKADYNNGLAYLHVYEPAGWTLVGSVTTTMITGEDADVIKIGNGENGIAAGTTSYFEHIVIDYTTAAFPLGPLGAPGSTVSFGGSTAASARVLSSTNMTAVTPPHAAGAFDVTVTNPDGQSAALPSGFTFTEPAWAAPTVTSVTPTTGPISGGTGLTITGTGFQSGATVIIGGSAATGVSVINSTTMTASTPAHVAGAVSVTVTNLDGQSGTRASGFTYVEPAGVAFDAVGPGIGGASVSSGSSLSWNHTITSIGSNLLLTVGVAVGKIPDTGLSLAVSYNGVPMTSAGIVHSNNQSSGFVQMFYLKAPAPGTHTVQVTLTGGTASIEGGSVSFSGVDQTTPIRNIATSFGSGTSPRVSVASAAGDMVVDALVTGCIGTITSSQTLRWLRQVNCSTAGGNGAQSTAPGAASVTMGYTVPSDYWGMIGMDVVAAVPQSASFDFTLSNEGNKSIAQGSAVTNAVTATLSSGTPEPVTLTVAGLPAGVTASYNPTSCSPTCSTTLTISAGASAPTGTSTITVTGTAGSVSHTTTFTLSVTTASGPDTTPPAVSLTAPANNATVSGNSVTISATASDDVGVVGVQFQLDGSNLGTEDTTSPYAVPWNTTTGSNGPHQLTAVARDAAGNTATSTIAVTVANPVSYFPQAYTVNLGTYTSGTLASLTADDNNYLIVKSTTTGTTRQSNTDFQFSGVTSASRLDYSIQLKSSATSTTLVMSAYNYVTNTWTQLNTSTVGKSETTINLSITSAVANYISSGGGVSLKIQSSKSSNHSLSYERVNLTVTP